MNTIQKNVLKRKEIADMSERELLEELVVEKRRDETIRIVKYIVKAVIAAVIIVLLLIYGPKIIEFFSNLSNSVNTLNTKLQEISDMITSLNESVQSFFSGSGLGGLFH